MPGPRGASGLRELFERPGLVRIVGAHNPLGARLAERAGFDGVWSSGLEVSASHGLPDADLLTMSEFLDVARSMAEAVAIPVIADCDAGYGNASNVMHMTRRYEAAGVAAIAIEDKRFPKMNSFIPGRQELATLIEFAGKIAAAKSAQRGSDLMVIARVEALVAGWGLDEAMRRAEAYADAGADAVLIHAKGDSPDPVLEFLRNWRLPHPVVVVPTTYHTVTAQELAAAGAKMVIYANHGLRAMIAAVSETFAAILRDGRTTAVEERIAPLATVFDLQGMEALKQAEQRFLSRGGKRLRAVLQAGEELPVSAAGAAVEHQVGALRRAGIDNITVVADQRTAHVRWADVTVVRDPEGPSPDAGDVVTHASTDFDGHTVLARPDVLFDAEPVMRLTADEHDVTVLVDVSGTDAQTLGPSRTVALSETAVRGRRLRGTRSNVVTAFGSDRADGVFAGLALFSPAAFVALHKAVARRRSGGESVGLEDLLNDLIAEEWAVHAVETASGWAEFRTEADARRADLLLAGKDR